MENKLLSFNEFKTLYESFGFIYEAQESNELDFTPKKSNVTSDDLISLFGGKEIDEDLDAKAFSIMKKGETSERIKQLQKDLGLPDLGKYNGVFGDETDKAVRAFQTKNKLTVDGKVGVQTLRKMLELKGDKTPDKTIVTKYIKVTTPGQAKSAGIDPELLNLYDITIVNNGVTQYVILMPRKDSAAKAKVLQAKGAFKGLEWLAEGAKYFGKALVYTATGLTLIPLEIAKAMISGIASASKFLVGGAAYVMGAGVQGILNIGKWARAAGKAIYAKISTAANEFWTSFCYNFAKVSNKLGKASMSALVAFMTGVKAVAYTFSGIALAAFKSVATLLDPAVKSAIQGAKDAGAFITNGMAWISQNLKAGGIDFRNKIVSGWEYTKTITQNAWNGVKAAANSGGEAMYKAAKDAYNATSSFLSSMYDSGKKAWESLSELTGNPIFESREFAFENIDFTIA